jgi:hypothetical protein
MTCMSTIQHVNFAFCKSIGIIGVRRGPPGGRLKRPGGLLLSGQELEVKSQNSFFRHQRQCKTQNKLGRILAIQRARVFTKPSGAKAVPGHSGARVITA